MDVGIYFSEAAIDLQDIEKKLEEIKGNLITTKLYKREYVVESPEDYQLFFDASKEFSDFDIVVDPIVVILINDDSSLKVSLYVDEQEVKSDIVDLSKDMGSIVLEYKNSYFKMIKLFGKGNMKVIIKAGLVSVLKH